MIERKTSGFFEWDADPRFKRPHSISLESGRVDACIAHYNGSYMRGLFGSRHFGFFEEDLDFLHLTRLKPVWLWFWDVTLKDVQALYTLEELDVFGMNPKRPGIDFFTLPAHNVRGQSLAQG